MLVDFYNQHKRTINLVIVFLGISLIGWLIYYFVFSFHITSITPNPANASYKQPRLEITFNKDIETEGLKVESDSVKITSRVSGKNKIEVNLNSDRVIGETYSITLVSIKSVKGDQIRNQTINLAAVISDASLSDSDKKILLDTQQENKPNLLNDPITGLIPYSTLEYSLDSTNEHDKESGKLIVAVTIYLSSADIKIDRQGAIDRAKQAAFDYLRTGVVVESGSAQGVNPDDYAYTYDIRE